MSRLLPICPGRRGFGALLPTVTLGCVCVMLCVCVCGRAVWKEVNAAPLRRREPTRNYGHRSPKGIRKHGVIFGNKWGCFLGFFFKRNAVDFHLWNGLFVARGRGQRSKLVSNIRNIKTKAKQESRGLRSSRRHEVKVNSTPFIFELERRLFILLCGRKV